MAGTGSQISPDHEFAVAIASKIPVVQYDIMSQTTHGQPKSKMVIFLFFLEGALREHY